jgi:hypothetical protein
LPEYGIAGKESESAGKIESFIFRISLKTDRSLTSRTGQRIVLAATECSYPVPSDYQTAD